MSTSPHTWVRLYVPHQLSDDVSFELDVKASHYLSQVMRLRLGDSLRIFNGSDGEWRATIAQEPKGKKSGVILHAENLLRPQQAEPDIWLCAAPIKRHYFDFAIMKATELGVSVIQPVLTERTQIRDISTEHSLAIAIEAAEQSERLSLPEIRKPMTLDALIKTWPEKRLALICAEHGEAQPVVQALSGGLAQARPSAAIFTGPEGGYTTEEIERLRALPESLALRLGPRILRADTAALAALSCWQAHCGDWQRRNGVTRDRD